MYYPCSENKGADQLRGYREADLRLCFRPCKLLVFSRTGSDIFENGQLRVCHPWNTTVVYNECISFLTFILQFGSVAGLEG